MEVWAFSPQREISEALEWRTDVIRCRSREYRQSVRAIPRQEIAHRYLLTAAELAQAGAIARMSGGRPVRLPLWAERCPVDAIASGAEEITVDVSGTSLVLNDYVVIWETPTKYQIRQVGYIGGSTIEVTAAVTLDFGACFVMPIREAYLQDGLTAEKGEFDLYEVSARFMLTDTRDEANATPLGLGTYQSRPVLDIDLILDSAISEEFVRDYTETDSNTGLIYRADGRSVPERRSQMTLVTIAQAEYLSRRRWLCWLRGQQKSFWVPSRLADFTLAADAANTDTYLLVSDAGIRTIGTFPFHLYIERSNGAAVMCQVNSATLESTGIERLTLSAAIGTALSTSTVTRVSILTRYRLATDRIEFSHKLQHAVTITANLVEVFQ